MLVQRNVVDGYVVVGVSPSGCPSISEVFLSDGNEETFACCRVHILLAEYAENKCQFTLSLTVATLI